MKKINVAKLLKDCPQNMELDCRMFNKVTLFTVDDREGVVFPITVFREDGNPIVLTKYGQYTDADFAKCVIFPKGKTTWEGFVPPCQFKDGDIITDSLGTCIFKGEGEFEGTVNYYCGISNDYFRVKDDKCNPSGHYGYIVNYRLSTQEEKERLFRAIKNNGYQWNSETKTLDKLPKFKVGYRIKPKGSDKHYIIKDIKFDRYILNNNGFLRFNDEHDFELVVEPKFKVGDRIKNKTDKWLAKRTIKSYDKNIGYYTTINDWVRIEDQDNWELVPVEPKFKVGDRVRIKSIDWYNENKDEFDQVKCGNQIFTYPMTKLCSKTVTIRCVNTKDCYYVLYEDGGYRSWTDEMIECKVEEENKPKFKDGDVLYIHSASAWICIYNEGGEIANVYYKYVAMSSSTFTHDDDAPLCCRDHVKEIRLATEEEKEKLFKAIKDNGYQWNTETKTLEKLPKFKVGDKIRNVIVNLGIHTVINVDTSGYAVKKDDQYGNFRVNFDGEKNWELVPDVKPFDKVGDRIKSVMSSRNKFDIKTLKPFDKVLMRSSNAREWVATFYSHYSNNKFYGCGMCCSQCIPYEGNEHLLGTTDDCDTFYKTSE